MKNYQKTSTHRQDKPLYIST